MKPTIGRIVHYHAPTECGGGYYAGIVVGVAEDGTTVELTTFGPNSLYHNHNVPFAETPTPGCWSWPPRA